MKVMYWYLMNYVVILSDFFSFIYESKWYSYSHRAVEMCCRLTRPTHTPLPRSARPAYKTLRHEIGHFCRKSGSPPYRLQQTDRQLANPTSTSKRRSSIIFILNVCQGRLLNIFNACSACLTISKHKFQCGKRIENHKLGFLYCYKI